MEMGGPGELLCINFAPQFTEWSRSMGINHAVSAAYNAQSNGAAERGVASIKALLTKMGKKGQLT